MSTTGHGLKPCAVKCATCPFRDGSPYENLRPHLTEQSAHTARICHSTGTNAIKGRTKRPPAVCRGSRDLQLVAMHAAGVIKEPTDAAWDEAWANYRPRRSQGSRGV